MLGVSILAKLLLNPENASYHKECISKLTPDTERTFGTLTAHGLLTHLIFAIQMSMGEVDVPDQSKPFVRFFMRKFAFEWVTTWPGGKIKGPTELTPTPEKTFDADKQRLLDYIDTFLAALEQRPDDRTIHPMLGSTTIRYWSRIHGLHMNHHFRQFGIG
jgi:hypothetical protein